MPVAAITNTNVKNRMPFLANVNGSIRPSNAHLLNIRPGQEPTPVIIKTSSLLGTISQFQDIEAEKAEEFNPGNPNPQQVEIAFLDPDADILGIHGSVKVLSECMSLNMFQTKSEHPVGDHVVEVMQLFKAQEGFKQLGEAYVQRIISGSFAFRNRFAINPKVTLRVNNEEFEFECRADNGGNEHGLETFVSLLANALSGESDILVFDYEFEGQINKGGEVYPSEEFTSNKHKTLFKLKYGNETNAAGMHSQKIGNAIRTIDTWYTGYEKVGKALPIDPYGPDKASASARRKPGSGESFYEILTSLDEIIERLNRGGGIDNDMLYFAAMMVRGGVFTRSK